MAIIGFLVHNACKYGYRQKRFKSSWNLTVFYFLSLVNMLVYFALSFQAIWNVSRTRQVRNKIMNTDLSLKDKVFRDIWFTEKFFCHALDKNADCAPSEDDPEWQ
jgi:hypothetical protein